MHISPLGPLTRDDDNDWLISQPLMIPALNTACEFLLEAYTGDSQPQDFTDAVTAFIGLQPETLQAAETAIFNYYLDCARLAKAEGETCVQIAAPADVWQHIQFGSEALVCRRHTGDQAIYILFECDCDWNAEDGLQLVFRKGKEISKVGPFDDFLSYADVYGLPELDRVIYQSPG
ncbi:DUF6985 domain-containing protein [Undibacterium griseum]|uniref:DUF6985 domain-containing protein n=1 Tax=Undibacterium griseum TaxID=2762295 RepID=A0ABR6YIP2_9BURK|nr:hypothetical protein [Undibacterium griseum]MBC3883724.1 hypothetical protein [Undibacterium griseum]